MRVRAEFETYIVRWANKYVLVPVKESRHLLAALVNKRVKMTLIHDSNVYELEVTISDNPQYGAVVFLPISLEPTWKKLHETGALLKAIVEVGDDGNHKVL
jgi:hypothetical protein